jgi:hypothetical protein
MIEKENYEFFFKISLTCSNKVLSEVKNTSNDYLTAYYMLITFFYQII